MLVLKCKTWTLSLVKPIFEKHKVLFILTFFFFKLEYHRKQKRISIIVDAFPAAAGSIQKSELGISIGDFVFFLSFLQVKKKNQILFCSSVTYSLFE